jgi:hypothetical protein
MLQSYRSLDPLSEAGLYDGGALLHVRVHGPGLAGAGRRRRQQRTAAARLCVAYWPRLRAAAGRHAHLLPALRHRQVHDGRGALYYI